MKVKKTLCLKCKVPHLCMCYILQCSLWQMFDKVKAKNGIDTLIQFFKMVKY